MTEQAPMSYPTVTPYLFYEDVDAALGWLSNAFGFTERLRHASEDGTVNHAEVRIGDDAVLMLGAPGPQYHNPERSGHATAMVYVIVDDVDAQFARARAAGAKVLMEPTDQEYGDRRCDVADLEGHMWSFATPIREVAPTDWGATVPE